SSSSPARSFPWTACPAPCAGSRRPTRCPTAWTACKGRSPGTPASAWSPIWRYSRPPPRSCSRSEAGFFRGWKLEALRGADGGEELLTGEGGGLGLQRVQQGPAARRGGQGRPRLGARGVEGG